jgi:hypothetical protein
LASRNTIEQNEMPWQAVILFYRITACQGISFCSIVLRLAKAFHFVLSYHGLPRHFILFYRITAYRLGKP